MRLRSMVRRALAWSALACALAAPLAAQRRGHLAGRIQDSAGLPALGAELVLIGTGRSLPTSATGRFGPVEVPAGQLETMVRAIGYRLRFVTIAIPPADTAFVIITVDPLPVRIAPLEATAPTPTAEALPDFTRRMRVGNGYFITEAELRRAAPVTVSDYLARLPVLRVIDTGGVAQAISARGPRLTSINGRLETVPCVMRVALDGQILPAGASLNLVPPAAVGAIEVYPGPASIPLEFSAATREIGCGLIVVWTRRH